jgi:hypothetical protein
MLSQSHSGKRSERRYIVLVEFTMTVSIASMMEGSIKKIAILERRTAEYVSCSLSSIR